MKLGQALTVEDLGLSRDELPEVTTFQKSELAPRDDENYFPPSGPALDRPVKTPEV